MLKKFWVLFGVIGIIGLALWGLRITPDGKAATDDQITITRTPNYCECGNWTRGEDGWWYKTLRCSGKPERLTVYSISSTISKTSFAERRMRLELQIRILQAG